MAYTIRVKTHPSDQQYLFDKTFNSQEEFQTVKKLCISRREIGFFESMLITARTNTLENCATDFFFPTLINHALKTHDLALKILMTIDLFIVDICTLPIRLITLLPRMLYNEYNRKETHPFYIYLINQGVPAEALGDHIFLEQQYIEGRIGLPQGLECDQNRVTSKLALNFIQLPKGVSSGYKEYSGVGIVHP